MSKKRRKTSLQPWRTDLEHLHKKRDEIIISLGKEGFSRGDIAIIMRLTRPRVAQILIAAGVSPNPKRAPHKQASGYIGEALGKPYPWTSPLPIPDFQALSALEAGTQVKLWGDKGLPALLVKPLTWGNVLVQYLEKPYHNSRFWCWSDGGGSSAGDTLAHALEAFEKRVEFFQNFWTSLLQESHCSIIFDGRHYVDGGESSKSGRLLGFGGSRWYLERLSDNALLTTNNLWCQGKLPKELARPDNFGCLSKEEWNARVVHPGLHVSLPSPYGGKSSPAPSVEQKGIIEA